ncbi:MAG: hypothetical protein MR966_07385 [Lachnospiraceae bacterium]|nr:hypothetical protein [Lachnospiraceae bacterium]
MEEKTSNQEAAIQLKIQLKGRLKELSSYRIAMKPELLSNGVRVCGRCHKRINPKHDYCHRCGQRQLKN